MVGKLGDEYILILARQKGVYRKNSKQIKKKLLFKELPPV